MKVMVVTPYLPHRRVGHGGGTAVRDLISWLARKHEVLVASLLRPGESGLVGEVEDLGVTVAALPFRDARTRGLARTRLLGSRALAVGRSLRSGYPLFVEKYWQRGLVSSLLRLTDDFAPDAVQIEYLQLALLCRALRHQRERSNRSGPRLILNSHELGSLPRERRARNTGNPATRMSARLEAAAWRRLQIDATGWADATLCVTPGDRELYAAMGGRNLYTVPLGMDTDAVRVERNPVSPDQLLFVGSFGHRPNRLAADFLLNRVWPVIAARQPEVRLVLAGRGSRSFLAGVTTGDGIGRDRVQATGFVDDLTPLFRSSRLFVAPLTEGGGIKIKILEAMSRGLPVVTSPVGAEGIADTDDDCLLISPCDDTFAQAVLTALADPQTITRAERARRHIVDHFSWDAITDRLTGIYAGD